MPTRPPFLVQERGGWRQVGGCTGRSLLLPSNHAGGLRACVGHSFQQHQLRWLHLGYPEQPLLIPAHLSFSWMAQHLGRLHLHTHRQATTDQCHYSISSPDAVTCSCTHAVWSSSASQEPVSCQGGQGRRTVPVAHVAHRQACAPRNGRTIGWIAQLYECLMLSARLN